MKYNAAHAEEAHPKWERGDQYLIQVIVKPGEDIDSAIKRFKKAVMNSGITKEARMHERYEKPSDRKRRELKASLRKIEKQRRKQAAKERD